jgi:hypothetical protein
MSLILAIEPNKNQAQQLGALVRAHLKAELVTAPTAAAALSALGDRIPDVVLTPALFGLRDEEALTERLRQLGSDASHVQTLAIPILAAGSSRGTNASLLGRRKDKGDAEVGCDPAVFAEQIRIYLQRAAVERRAQASEAAARAMAPAPASADATPQAFADLTPFMVGADELDVDSLELTAIGPPAPAPAAPPAAAAPHETNERRGKTRLKPQPQPATPVEEELGLVSPPAAGPPLWRVTESIEDFYGNAEAFAETPAASAADSATTAARSADASVLSPEAGNVAAHVGHPASPLTVSAATTTPRRRRTAPQPDDWSYFDASESAFKALIRRLDEIAGSAA